MSQSNHKPNWLIRPAASQASPLLGQHKPSWTVSRKILWPIIVFTAILMLSLSVYMYVSTRQRDRAETEATLNRMEQVTLSQLDNMQTLALGLATQTANSPEIQAAFAAQNRKLLTELTLPTFNIIHDDFAVKQYQFFLPPATSFLRLHQLDKFGDDLSSIRATFLEMNKTQAAVSGIEIGRGGLGMRGAVPVSYQGKYLGGLEVGLDIGSDFLNNLKKQYGVEAQLMLEKEAAQAATFAGSTAETVGPADNLLFQASTLSEPFYADASIYPRVLAGESVISTINVNNRTYAVISFPLKDYSGKVIGILEIFLDRTDVLAAQSRNLLTTILTSLAILLLGGFLITRFINRTVQPISTLTETASAVAAGDLERRAVIESGDEIGILANAFNDMTSRLRELISGLESRVAERTRNLELAAEVGRTVSQVRALDIMLTEAAELIRQQFDLYYVQVYLVNPSQTYLNLQAGTGQVGTELLGRNHRLPFNTDSINGRAAVEKKSVVITDTTSSATFKPNPLLPDTRSEMAVPLMIGERTVGVLDMQSQTPGSLNQDTLAAFEALAGQVAIAIQNANFLAETELARAEVEAQAQRLTRANWEDYLDAIHKPEETGFVFEQNKVVRMLDEVETRENALVTPISVTGEELGKLVVELEGKSPIANTDELVASVARQVSQQIENLRLLDSAERYRLEAEEASRRLTREGWKSYTEKAEENLSFIYDLKEVRLQNSEADQAIEVTGYTLPFKVREEAIGKLVVQGLDADDEESVALANAVAERLGAHLETLRQFEETQRGQMELDKRARQLASVAEVSSVSSRELDIQKMLKSVVFLTQRKFSLYHAHVFTYNQQSDMLAISACGWKEGDEHEGTHGTTTIPLTQEQSLVARSARNQQVVIVNDVHSEPGWLPNALLPDTQAELAVPLLVGDTLLGVLDVQSDQMDAFTEEDASIYTTLASQIATALQNAQSYAKAQQQAERESKLNIISQKIQSATTVEAVLQIAARELGHTLGAPLTIAQLGLKRSNGN